MRNIFLQKAYTKCGAKTIPIPFSEKWKLSASLDQLAKVSDSLFLSFLYTFLYIYFRQYVFIACQAEGYQSILKLGCLPLAFTSYEAFFKKSKKRSGTSLPIFCIIFEEKYFCWYVLLIDQVSLSSCLYVARYCAICVL